MDDRLKKSEIAMLKVQFRAIEKDIIINKPTSEGHIYDCILDIGGELKKAQVKYAGQRIYKNGGKGVVAINLVQHTGRGRLKPYYSSDIDILLIYLQPKDVICCFEKDMFKGKKKLSIRYEKALNNQKSLVPFFDSYIW